MIYYFSVKEICILNLLVFFFSSCVPCPPGSYIDVNTTKCMKCPANTIVHSGNAWGIESCIPCGEGLHTTDNVHCVTNCKYKSPDGKDYDFTSLAE